MDTDRTDTIRAQGKIDDAGWQRILSRDPAAVAAAPLYAPLLASPDAADECFVLGRIAQTLDGRIATPSGTSFWISGQQDILHTHRLRALFDAVLVGAATVRADDPLLTTRLCQGPSPVRVVVDADRRLDDGYRVFRGGPATLLLCAEDADGPTRLGTAEVVRLPRAAGGGLDPGAVVAALRARGVRRIFIEGGGVTVSRFLAAGVLDRLHVTVAPLLLGCGIPAFTLPGVSRPEDGIRLNWTLHRLGDDLLLDIALKAARR
ncbi:RibD family protein [Limobrevibacterium gyesilva]|uniref:RibD family protein n=1 Tax=Limobrevibacterium gyesilva TaxID=2991712 RepID=A0AA42CFP0_9PROT|nr:RibD family protein [Limobrevibacterium gyesilva]MCW3475126.1 RibD family protein [Limobrevibacterium gyesilva]